MFLLELNGQYKIKFKSEKVMKVSVRVDDEKGKEFPVVTFDTELMKLLNCNEGVKATFICKDGYISKFKKGDNWYSEPSCIIEEVMFGEDQIF